MKDVELYGRVRYAVRIEGLSERAAARRFGIDPRTVSKMIKFSGPPGYVRKKPPAKPKLDPFIPSPIDQNPCAHWRNPMDMMRQGWSTSLFQASQQWSTRSSSVSYTHLTLPT